MKQQLKRLAENVVSRSAALLWRTVPGPRLVVLMYHRVLPPDDPERRLEQPGMYVSPQTLEMHLTLLKAHFEPVHLDDWVRRAAAGQTLPRLACAITFDDGWRDNYVHGFPVLQRQQVPATIFLVSSLIGTRDEFWPNRLARLLAIDSSGKQLPRKLAELLAPVLEAAAERGEWIAEHVDRAIELAKGLPEDEIQALLSEAQGQGSYAALGRAILDEQELHAMSASGLIRYGSHTRTHFRCREGASDAVLEQEIGTSRAEIAARVAQPIDLFCFPNGDFTPAALRVVRKHYLAAVTTQSGWHSPAQDAASIRRIGVHEDVSNRPESFLARLSGVL
ncbi:MAG TPA: polysaccharide deacetylase family protein [Steroidobacter sp.]|uniref:polysaccharide deacetylase family protein n=1 Tax=Steroidobacter sp. TaxID=1978227 RepID=UPI002ED9A332